MRTGTSRTSRRKPLYRLRNMPGITKGKNTMLVIASMKLNPRAFTKGSLEEKLSTKACVSTRASRSVAEIASSATSDGASGRHASSHITFRLCW